MGFGISISDNNNDYLSHRLKSEWRSNDYGYGNHCAQRDTNKRISLRICRPFGTQNMPVIATVLDETNFYFFCFFCQVGN